LSGFDGVSVGLFGGSFNPAHSGHMHVAMCGLTQLGLDHIWWMVSPQNPLKPEQPSYESRVASVEALGLKPRMHISNFEIEQGTQYTIDTIRAAQARYPRTRFVFLMGADNFEQLPKWRAWQDIMYSVPIAVIARPGNGLKPRLGQAARMYRDYRLGENDDTTP